MLKNSFVAFLFAIFLVGCNKEVKKSDITLLNGYWEIEKVEVADGEDKEYGMNEHFDFFEINDKMVGIRKKVTPQLNGTFLVDDTFEDVKVVFEGGKVFLVYKTAYATWKEEIKVLEKEKLVLENQNHFVYQYKKTGPINLTKDEK